MNQPAEPSIPETPTSEASRHSRATRVSSPGSRRRIQMVITAVWNISTQARVNAACIRNPSPPRESEAAR